MELATTLLPKSWSFGGRRAYGTIRVWVRRSWRCTGSIADQGHYGIIMDPKDMLQVLLVPAANTP